MDKETIQEIRQIMQNELLFNMFLVERNLVGEFQELCVEKTASALHYNQNILKESE